MNGSRNRIRRRNRQGTSEASFGGGFPAVGLALFWMLIALALWVWRGWRTGPVDPILPPGGGFHFPTDQLVALATGILLLALALAWGGAVRRAAGMKGLPPVALLGVDLLLGHTTISLLVFTVATLQFLPLGLAVLLPGFFLLPRTLGDYLEAWKRIGATDALPKSSWPWLLGAALLFFFTLLLAMAPAMESDGMRYHLFAPQEWLKAGGFVHLPLHAFTNLPLQLNLLFLAGMLVADERIAHLIHALHLPAVALFAGLLAHQIQRSLLSGRRGGKPAPVWSVAAGVTAASAPVALTIAAWPVVDLATTAFLLGGTWALTAGSQRTLRGRLILSGILYGAAIGTKLTAIVPAFFGGLVVLVILLFRVRPRPALVLAFVVPMLVVAGPWFAKNLVLHGNPVYPAAAQLFGNEEWPAEAQALYQSKAEVKGFGRTPTSALLMPLDVTLRWATNRRGAESLENRFLGMRSSGFEDHNPGPSFLALLPLALIGLVLLLRQRRRSILVPLLTLQLLGGLAFWFMTYHSVRFLLFPMALVVAIGVPVLSIATLRSPSWLRQGVLGILGLIAISGAAWQVTYGTVGNPRRPLHAALGMVEKDLYLSTMLNFYDAVDYLNREVLPGERVLYIGEHRGVYARYEVELSDWFDVPLVLAEIRRTPDNDQMLAQWRERGVRHVLWNYAELGLYLRSDFMPRFTEEEWARFTDLQERLLQRSTIVFIPRENVFVIDLDRLVEQ